MSRISKQIKYGAIISYLALGINIIIALLYTPWMVSCIGQSNYALYTLASSFISLFMVDFGLSSAVSRYVAKYRAEGKEHEIDSLISVIVKLYLIIDVFILGILAVVFFLLPNIYKGLTAGELSIYKQLYAIVAVYSVVSFPFMPLSGILNAYEKFIQLKICDLFQKVFMVGMTVAALLAGYGVTAMVSVYAVSGMVTVVIKIILVKKATRIKVKFRRFDKGIIKELAGFSVWITVISIAARSTYNIAPTILGVVSTSSEIAVFSPANILEGYFYSIAGAVNGLFLPTISRYIAKDEEDKIEFLMIRVGQYQLILMGLIYVGFACVGRDFMLQWMGIDYVKAWSCALLMFVPDLLTFTQQIANTTILVKNKIKLEAFGYIGMAAICLGLSFPLSSQFGVIGASISIAVSYLALFIYMNVVYYKALHINIFRFYRECYGRFIIPIAAALVIGGLLIHFCIHIGGWHGLFVKGFCVVVVYIMVIWIALKKEERRAVATFIRSRMPGK